MDRSQRLSKLNNCHKKDIASLKKAMSFSSSCANLVADNFFLECFDFFCELLVDLPFVCLLDSREGGRADLEREI